MSRKTGFKIFIIAGIGIIGVGIIAILIAVALIVIFTNNYDAVYSRKITLDTSAGLTAQQRTEDFSQLCEHLEAYVPTLYEYEKLYGISYDEIKSYYSTLAANAENDFEYCTVIRGFLNNIPSAHMAVGFPSLSKIDEDFSARLSKNKTFVNAQDYWLDVYHNECRKYYDKEITQLVFAYYSGEYRGVAEPIDNDVYCVNKATLLTVNGVSADEFVKLTPSVYKLKYDHSNLRPFRDTVIFNDSIGEECTIEYLDADGEKHSAKMYYGAEADTVIAYRDYFMSIDGAATDIISATDSEQASYTTIGDMTAEKSEEHNLLYVCINSFESETADGTVMANSLKSLSEETDNIIIDIRKNRGGYYDYAKAVIGALSNSDIEFYSEVYVTEASYNKFKEERAYVFDESTGLYKTIINESVKGTAAEKKNIYLLVSDQTGSSADNFAYEFKKNNLGTIIGTNNTGGERNGTMCLDYLDISGIYFAYTRYAAMNSDGTFSSVTGTSPDIYLGQPIEAYFIRVRLEAEGKDINNLENRLEWDNVLIETVKMIEESP